MKKSLLRILLEFIAVTLPLTWLWMSWGQDAYVELFRRVAFPILLALGVTNFPLGLVTDRMISFVPFLALMLVTPQIERVRRWVGIAVGFLILFVSHIGLSWWAWMSFVRDGSSEESMLKLFPALVLSDALPFLLWALFANRFLRGLLARVIPPTPARVPKAASAPPPPPRGSPPQSSPEADD